MGILDRLLPAKTAATSTSIRAEIERAESEIAAHSAKIAGMLNGIAGMTDEQHVAAEANAAALRRAVTRLESRVTTLAAELPAIVKAEESAAAAERDAALLKRAKAATKANTVDARALLSIYADQAAAIADVLAKLKAIDAETTAVNTALRSNPVTEAVTGYNTLHRTIAEQAATERREMAPHWIYRDAPPQPDEVFLDQTETVVRATLDSNGKPIPPAGAHYGRFGQVIPPQLEQREVVTCSGGRRAVHAPDLTEVRLPPASAGDEWHWPRP
jgi:hypothetical protein